MWLVIVDNKRIEYFKKRGLKFLFVVLINVIKKREIRVIRDD